MPKLNSSNLKLQEELIKIGLIGLRNLILMVGDLMYPMKLPTLFWRKFRTAIKSAKPEALIIGETGTVPIVGSKETNSIA